MGNFGDNEFSFPRFLKVPFVFVPKGNLPPLDWMAAHPGFVKFAANFVPRPQSASPTDPTAKPETSATEEPVPEAVPPGNRRHDIWPTVPPLSMEGDPRLARPFPERLLKIVPPPRALFTPLPDTRPEWLRRIVPPPEPEEPPDRLPTFDAFFAKQHEGMDPALQMMDADGHASVVRAGMKHLDAHNGDVHAALAAAKRARAAGPKAVRTAPSKGQAEGDS